jgi:dihydroorotate dehydrogenase (NAD+) catalytic subunit
MFPPISFSSPILNAAGSLGFAPNPRGAVDLLQLGAFFTNPVSLAPRSPAESRCLLSFPGGFLLHTGLPNPGLRAVVKEYAPRWARSPIPVIVSLLAGQPDEIARMVRRLETVEGVMGVELAIPPDATPDLALSLCQAAQGELPAIPCLPPGRLSEIGPKLKAAGISLVSLAAPRGALPAADGRLVRGRLLGPGMLPASLLAVAEAADLGFQVIGSGGISCQEDVKWMLKAAPSACIAVQLDSIFWKDGCFGAAWPPQNTH